MSGVLYLVAWAKPGDPAHQRAFGDLAQRVVGREPRVAYVGAANGDDPGWAKGLVRDLGKRHGVAVEHARTVGDGADLAAARASIERADLIYLGGGDVGDLVRALRSSGLDEVLRARHAAGASVLGVSAGAVAMCRTWIEWPDPIPEPPPPFDGGTLLPAFALCDLVIDVHSEEDDWVELRQCLALLAHEQGGLQSGFGVPRGGALVVADGKIEELGVPPTRIDAS